MSIRQLWTFLLLFISALCLAADGTVNINGAIIEHTCTVRTDQYSRTTLDACSGKVAADTDIKSEVVLTDPYISSWRDNEVVQRTTQPFYPAKEWKITQVDYW